MSSLSTGYIVALAFYRAHSTRAERNAVLTRWSLLRRPLLYDVGCSPFPVLFLYACEESNAISATW